jgi:TonB family protein
MRDVVSQTLIARATDQDRLTPMLGISFGVHVLLMAMLLLAPGGFGWRRDDEPRTVMTISLGGAPGPRSGGMTPMGGRPVQQAAPEQPKARPEPVRAPAAKAPEMTVPTKESPKRPPREQLGKTSPPDARGTTPTRGPREQLGSAVAETGGQGLGFGLSTGGGGTGGDINVGDFCCPEYLTTMLQLIQRNWSEKQQVAGTTTMRFTVRRDGSVVDVQVARSSGYAALDLASERALVLTKLPPLPPAYTNPQLTIHLNFQYQR